MFSLEGKVAFVTGCGSQSPGWGNGKAIAVLFARRGAAVYGVDVNRDAAEETRRIVEGEGGTFVVGAGDVTDRAAVEALVADCAERLGRVGILVNNVGHALPGDPATMSEETWDSQIDVNLKSAFLCCKAVLPRMEA